jgi:putative aldouronate transport system permease protein
MKEGKIMGSDSKSGNLTKLVISSILLSFSILCIIPIVSIISISLSNEADIVQYGYRLIPVRLSTTAYEFIFRNPIQILRAYFMSISVTVTGVILSLLIISMFAYTISRTDFIFRKKLSFYVFFTMLFNGGLVPWYMLISNGLHLKNTFWVLVIPYLTNAWFILLLRTYFQKIPVALIESARIDGSNEIRTYFSIVLPLSKPALATVGLFITLNYWNDWWLSMLFIEKQKLIPLQYLLARMMRDLTELLQNMTEMPTGTSMQQFPNESARMAMCLLAAGPMLFVFPFFQKYFVKGLTVGAVKG